MAVSVFSFVSKYVLFLPFKNSDFSAKLVKVHRFRLNSLYRIHLITYFENSLKQIFIIAWVCIAGIQLSAQELFFSNVPGIASRAYYNKVIGENQNGIYLLRFKDPGIRRQFLVEQYSHTLDFYAEQSYRISKKERLVKAFTSDTSLMFLVFNQKSGKKGIDLYTVKNNIKEIGSPKNLLKSEKIEYGSDPVSVEYDLNRKNFGVFLEEIDNSNRQVISLHCFNVAGVKIYSKSIELPENYHDARVIQTAMGENLELSAVIEIETNEQEGFQNKSRKKYMILCCDSSSDIAGKLIQEKSIYYNSPDLVYDVMHNKFILSAFYSFKSETGNQGAMTMEYSPYDLPISVNYNVPFPRALIKQVIGAKQESEGKELSNYFIRKLIPKSSGGYIIVAENFHKSSKFETIFVNGTSPQVTQSDIFNFEDVLVFNFDSVGNMIWYKQIHKKQSSVASISYYHSIGVFVTEDKINIIYNDDNENDNRIMYVTLNQEGIVTLKMLLRSNSNFTAVVPFEGKQVGYNRLVIPLLQDRNMSLLKILEPEVLK